MPRSRIEMARIHKMDDMGFIFNDTSNNAIAFFEGTTPNQVTVSGTNISAQLIENQEVVFYDTSSGEAVVQLPATPTDGDTVTFSRAEAIAGIKVGKKLPNNLRILPGDPSTTILGDSGESCLTKAAQEFTMTYDSSTDAWA